MKSGSRIPLQVARGCVVASVQVDLDEEILRSFQEDLLERVQRSQVSGVIMDLSGVRIIDSQDFKAIRRTISMAELLGARTVISGMQPGVVASLVDLEANLDDIIAVFNLDDAFRVMDNLRAGLLDGETDERE